jgi:hypothetical protein
MWDLALIYLDAYKHLNGNPTANDVDAYLEQLRGFPGENAIYDFPAKAQRGLGQNGDIITQWDPARKAFTLAAKPGGYR